MMGVASEINELGRLAHQKGHLPAARLLYACAAGLAPEWEVVWFNRGLVAKAQRRWPACRTFYQRAAELDPNDPPAWWNLGIAATALGDWKTARAAWSRYGINVPDGNGPIDMDLGAVPIRVSPDDQPEVVWCQRLDPARAVIRSVPMAQSGRGYGDILLHDGDARGTRFHHDREVPVFDELQVLAPGRLQTFEVQIAAPTEDDVERLQESSRDRDVIVEDWGSSVRWLCQQCSEGTPHEHDHMDAPEAPWQADRIVGVAAPSEDAIRTVLGPWAGTGDGRRFGPIECVLKRR